MIIYLHGFRSGPESWKARSLRARMAEHRLADAFWCAQLPVSANAAMALAEAQIARCDSPPTVVGSSLGGYYATHLAEKWNAPAVLINPAVRPFETLKQHVGWQIHHSTGERVFVRPEYFAQLEKMYVPNLSLDRYWLLASRDDAVLDCQQAEARYAGAKQTVLDTGGHTFEAFADYLEAIYEFGTAWTGQAA